MRSAAPILRTFHHAQFDARALADAKAGQTVSVCLPARNEAATVGSIVTAIRRSLVAGLDVLPHPVALQWAALHERGFEEPARRRIVDLLEAVDGPAAGQTVAAAYAWHAFGAQDLGQEA